MLSRTADSLYWMARYTERAENIARLMEVSYRMSLQMHGGGGYWGAALGITGLEAAYSAKHGAINANDVLRFMGTDFGNLSSILSCRESAPETFPAGRGSRTSGGRGPRSRTDCKPCSPRSTPRHTPPPPPSWAGTGPSFDPW